MAVGVVLDEEEVVEEVEEEVEEETETEVDEEIWEVEEKVLLLEVVVDLEELVDVFKEVELVVIFEKEEEEDNATALTPADVVVTLTVLVILVLLLFLVLVVIVLVVLRRLNSLLRARIMVSFVILGIICTRETHP